MHRDVKSCISGLKFIATLLNSILKYGIPFSSHMAPRSSALCECSRPTALASSERRFKEDAGHPERCGASCLWMEAVTSGPTMRSARPLSYQEWLLGLSHDTASCKTWGHPFLLALFLQQRSRERQGSPEGRKAQERSGELAQVPCKALEKRNRAGSWFPPRRGSTVDASFGLVCSLKIEPFPC